MKYLLLLGFSIVLSSPALAQAAAPGDDLSAASPRDATITVVASGESQRLDRTGQSISIVGADEIASLQGPDLTRVLERLPGVSFARNGGLGSTTSLFVRGANSEQLLVLVDGVRLTDIAAPSGGFDLGTLLPAGIGKLELLRGSNSVAWGSDAIGGVLAVTTDTSTGLRGAVEYGAHDTLDASAGGGISGQGYGLALDAGYTRTDGISAFAGGSEADPFRQWHVSGRGQLELAHGLALVAAGRYADSRIAFDGFPPPDFVFADTPEYQTTRQASGRTGLEYQGDGLSLAGGIALSDTRRAYFDPTFGSAPNFETSGRSLRADLTGRAELAEGLALSFGGDSEWTRFATTFDPRQSARLASGHALLGWHRGALDLAGGLRIDDHDRFGTHWTTGANASLALGGGWRLRASFGEGFKAPTLYQLFGFGGNAGLKPETSRSFDAGIELADRNAPLHFAATLFRRDARNLIDFLWPDGYFNVGRTRAEGIELEGDARVTPDLAVHAAYTYVKATNRAVGTDLARRPRHALTLAADWRTPLHGLALGVDLRVVGDSFDDAANLVRLDGYGLVTLRASVPLVGERLELYGRVENVTDQRYQTAAGFGTYARSAYAGLRAKW